jgi:AcrR family transcriptional regulator
VHEDDIGVSFRTRVEQTGLSVIMTVDRSVWYCQIMSMKTLDRSTARERLLAAADELFYAGGIHTVGIDRVIERAGVAKATLYNVFGSKDELIRSYLTARAAARQERLTRKLARYQTPRERLLGVFDVLGELFAEPGFRGCAFLNASAEAQQGGPVEEVSGEARAWVRALFVELGQAAGAVDAERLAQQLVLLYDGATVAAQMDRDPTAAATARAVAATLLDAATGAAGAGRNAGGRGGMPTAGRDIVPGRNADR